MSTESFELEQVKRAMVRDLRQAMRRKHVSQAALARRMGTSRSAVTRLLKEEDASFTLRLLGRIAVALEANVNLEFAEKPVPRKH